MEKQAVSPSLDAPWKVFWPYFPSILWRFFLFLFFSPASSATGVLHKFVINLVYFLWPAPVSCFLCTWRGGCFEVWFRSFYLHWCIYWRLFAALQNPNKTTWFIANLAQLPHALATGQVSSACFCCKEESVQSHSWLHAIIVGLHWII